MTPAGIEPATFRFVTQHLNHCATAVPPKLWCKPCHFTGKFFCKSIVNMHCYWMRQSWNTRLSCVGECFCNSAEFASAPNRKAAVSCFYSLSGSGPTLCFITLVAHVTDAIMLKFVARSVTEGKVLDGRGSHPPSQRELYRCHLHVVARIYHKLILGHNKQE
jgi:hypothetical protein